MRIYLTRFRLTAGAGLHAMLLLASLAAGFGGAVSGAAADVSVSKEYRLKAAFLYNFAKFVEWPESAFSGPNAPIVIGVLGKNLFGAELQNAVSDRKINGREIVVKPFATAEAAKGAHLLFVSAAEDARFGELKQALAGTRVLTVGETDGFAGQGGMITFALEGDKLRFEINLDSAEQAGLKISAQLLKLARRVRKTP